MSKTVNQLPRHPDASAIVAVQLKRKLELKNSELKEYIRPQKVINALKFLRDSGNQFYPQLQAQ